MTRSCGSRSTPPGSTRWTGAISRVIADIYRGGPVGVETMAAGLSEPRDTIEDVIEPYLLQVGLIARTARGRMLNASAWKHLGLNPPAGSQDGLFDQGK
jgi:Holliday junction DNA helicase RuvB